MVSSNNFKLFVDNSVLSNYVVYVHSKWASIFQEPVMKEFNVIFSEIFKSVLPEWILLGNFWHL
jgi:hypothetical protein